MFILGRFISERANNYGATEQIIGREGETATFLSRCPLNPNLRVIGFAPRQFNRSALSLETEAA